MTDNQRSKKNTNDIARRRFLEASAVSALTMPGVGMGSATNGGSKQPTEIANWHDLNSVRADLDGDYVLVRNLDDETDGYDEYVGDPEGGWEPIADREIDGDGEFSGTFDARGHVIADLEIDQPETENGGLFGGSDGTVENVTILNADITGNASTGCLVGQNRGKVMKTSVVGSAVTGDRKVGGLVGNNRSGEVKDISVYDADVNGRSCIGGLIGDNGSWGQVGESSVRNVAVIGDGTVGGLAGYNLGEVRQSSVHAASIVGENEVGGLAGTTSEGEVKNSYYNLDSVQINGEQQLTVGGIYDDQYQDWLANDENLDLSEYHSLTEENNWIDLTDEQSFRDALGFIGDSDLNWRLQTDLDLTNRHAGLYFPHFAGTLDGNGYSITVDLDLPDISRVGIVGQNSGNIFELTGKGTVTGAKKVGGLVGVNDGGKVRKSSIKGAEITGVERIGGLIGDNAGDEVVNSFVHNSYITGDRDVGGLIGVSRKGKIAKATVTEVGITGDWSVGGLIGGNSGSEVVNSFVHNADITGDWSVGGLIGSSMRGKIAKATVTEVGITGDGRVGGLIGSYNDEKPKAWDAENVTVDASLDDLVGFNTDW